MLAPLVFVGVVVAAALIAFAGGARRPRGAEIVYVWLAATPMVLCFIVPAIIGLTLGFVGPQTIVLHGISWVGVGLSALLCVGGSMLVVRAMARHEAWGWPLGAAVILATAPVAVLLTGIALMFNVRH